MPSRLPISVPTGLPSAGGRVLLCAALMSGCASSGTNPSPELTSVAYSEELGLDPRSMTETSAGVLIEDRIAGTGEEASGGDWIEVNYTGYFPNGRILDTNLRSPDSEPLRFRLGAREVIRGWDEGIPGMREGGVRVLVVPPALAYGRSGMRPAVPPDQVLIFEIQLVSVR